MVAVTPELLPQLLQDLFNLSNLMQYSFLRSQIIGQQMEWFDCHHQHQHVDIINGQTYLLFSEVCVTQV